MKFLSRALIMIANILLILMMIGCEAPAGSTGSPGAPGAVDPLEQALVDEGAGEAASEQNALGGTVSGASVDGGFGSGGEIDDPFAAIGPAFSGLGFQSYSSSCDPFEDTYGTCL